MGSPYAAESLGGIIVLFCEKGGGGTLSEWMDSDVSNDVFKIIQIIRWCYIGLYLGTMERTSDGERREKNSDEICTRNASDFGAQIIPMNYCMHFESVGVAYSILVDTFCANSLEKKMANKCRYFEHHKGSRCFATELVALSISSRAKYVVQSSLERRATARYPPL